MAERPYERLSGLDQSFLVFESGSTHMHVAATLIIESGGLRRPDGGIDIERIRAYTASRLHRIPRYRQRLAYTPLDRHPVWIDDEHFNIDYHVRHTALPRPGDERQLKNLAARVMSQQLDRAKPLWEIWVVEGLEGDRFALVAKTHHCLADGLAAVDLLGMLLCPDPSDEIDEVPPWVPRRGPGRLELVRDELTRLATTPLGVLRALRRRLDDPDGLGGEVVEHLRGLAGTLGVGLRGSEETPLNQSIGPHRRFDWVSLDLADVRDVKRCLGGTVNDIVLATVAGAVRRFLTHRGVDCDSIRFRVLAPVSVRSGSKAAVLGNQVSLWLIDLPIGEEDARLRLDQIRDTTAELKEARQALGAKLLTEATEWSGSTLLSLGVRLLSRTLPFNLIVTNVPGPQRPLYLLGSRLLEAYPVVPLFWNQALGVALFSYTGRLHWGINADWDRVPDLSLFVDAIVASFDELRAAAAESRVASRPKRRRTRPPGPDRPIAEA
ncbi:MAG: wax ester/triacylglycerol synthase family O-acyltransferase [Myxococcota bacterium]